MGTVDKQRYTWLNSQLGGRGPTESLLLLHQDILRLISLAYAYEGPKSTHTNAFAVDAFLKALGNHEIANKIRELDPVDLDEAVKHARRLESYARCDVAIPTGNQG